ncbi:MAG: cytochrome ubiquinol oxidase subunit I, partial [Candidatus Eremiobacteraeota bacterium]|nr:cytochrome ubiquinol oxidase subunit I [Candidatus Eremiobacteraeota bacterium]
RFVGDVFGSALAAEGIFAFFLESGFLAVLVFGWDRVGPKMHLFSTLMVFLGSVFSAIWIVVANSWQQTPAGYHIVWHDVQGEQMPRAEITDFWAMVFNPSSVDRLTHVLIGAFVLGGWFVASVSAFYLLKGRHQQVASRCMKIALPTTLAFTILAALSGHQSAQTLVVTQPAKLAAMEAHFTS